jgi:hypothetical protein
MTEKIGRISNPLTIIAIFAGLAEVSSTVAVALLKPEVQKIFIWFMIGFPSLLILLFFCTLLIKPNVLYAPGDFQDEENFLKNLNNQYFKKVVITSSPDGNNVEQLSVESTPEPVKRIGDTTVESVEFSNKVKEISDGVVQGLRHELQVGGRLNGVTFSRLAYDIFSVGIFFRPDRLKTDVGVSSTETVMRLSTENKTVMVEMLGPNIKSSSTQEIVEKLLRSFRNLIETSTT